MKNKYNGPCKIIRSTNHNATEIELTSTKTSTLNFARLKPHVQFLDHTMKRHDNKFSEILLETAERSRRGISNGLGSIWKTLTENLDASDGKYYDQCIDKLEKDDREIKNLIKEQIQVTTSTIKNFNYTRVV